MAGQGRAAGRQGGRRHGETSPLDLGAPRTRFAQANPCPPAQSGKLSLEAVRAYQGELQAAGAHLTACLEQVAGCIGGSVQYRE